MRSIFVLSILAVLLTACLPTPMLTDSGIEGQVTIGPTCPVMQINDPCPDRPYQATLTILSGFSHLRVIQFQTDANGYFRVALSPGEYILHPESPNSMPHAGDQNFTVQGHEFAQVSISYDSGIR
jgi:hypothetical protein